MSEPGHTTLERARKELRQASDASDRIVQEQVDSIQQGIFEERKGDLTQEDPEPKPNRIVEVAEKLDGLADETDGEARDHIIRARDHCLEYLEGESEG